MEQIAIDMVQIILSIVLIWMLVCRYRYRTEKKYWVLGCLVQGVLWMWLTVASWQTSGMFSRVLNVMIIVLSFAEIVVEIRREE